MSAGISAALTMARPPVPAPTGHIALVATVVDGNRTLWDTDPEAMSAGLRLATALLKRLLVDHRGYEVSADGGAMIVAFSDALAAARPAIAERLTSDPLGGRAAAKRSSAPGQQPDGASPTAC